MFCRKTCLVIKTQSLKENGFNFILPIPRIKILNKIALSHEIFSLCSLQELLQHHQPMYYLRGSQHALAYTSLLLVVSNQVQL